MKRVSISQFLCIGAALLLTQMVEAQNYPSQEQFGKNRVQYQRFEWKILKTNNFEIYHYGAGTPLATLAAQYAESEFDRITEVLGYTPYNRIKIFLYNSPQELLQSNMGMANSTDLSETELNLAKSRLEIAFSGDQVSFRKQLIKEISRLFVYDMLYGGSLKDALQSSLLLSLPDWFMSGIAAYIAEGWSPELDDYMRDAIVHHQMKKPSLLTGAEATLVGQSIWNYIAERYGKDNISNILNLTRIIRTEQTSVASTLGVSFTRFLKEWRDFYTNMATTTSATYKDPAGDWRQELDLPLGSLPNAVRLSLDNQYVAVTNRKSGKYTVDIINTESRAKTTIIKGKYSLEKRTYLSRTPLVAWSRNNGLAIITEENGRVFLEIFDISDKGKSKLRLSREIRGINQVSDFDISNDGSTLALSADSRGQNDLFLFNVGRSSLLQLTSDLYDDRYPHFSGSSTTRVLFTSNRLKDSLTVTDKGSYKTVKEKTALFIHDGNPRAQTVTRVVDSLGVISNPRSADENTFYFLSDYKGVNNLFKYELDIKRLSPVTGFNQNIRDYDYLLASGAFAGINWYNDKEAVIYQRRLTPVAAELVPTSRIQSISGVSVYKTEQRNNPAADASLIAQMANPRKIQLDSGEVDTDNYEFDADVLKTFEYRQRRGTTISSAANLPSRNRKRENITIKGPISYKSLFISNDATSDWRIDPIRGFGFAQSLTMNDLLENHIVKAGFFLGLLNFRTNNLWAEYNNLAHRIDYTVRVDRQSLYVQPPASQKYRYNRVAFTAAYPLNNNARVSLTPFFAESRLLDVSNISAADVASTYLGARGEFVYDNSRINGMNMMEGTRFKIRYDWFGGINGTRGFNRLAIDLRHYQKIHRDLIFATRLSFAHSGGKSPKQSVLGGMENWTGNNQDERTVNPLAVGLSSSLIPIDNRDIFFVEMATNLRGFNFNKVSGSSHLLFNAELRMPLVKYFYRGPITSNFLRNFQLVGFTDVGTAWTGKWPFNRQNSLNTEIIRLDFFSATVNNFRNPFLLGYGLGARTMLFGFYVKFDYAWGFDNGEVNKPIPYLTLGYDF
jgi:Tol biopolymer transport system component